MEANKVKLQRVDLQITINVHPFSTGGCIDFKPFLFAKPRAYFLDLRLRENLSISSLVFCLSKSFASTLSSYPSQAAPCKKIKTKCRHYHFSDGNIVENILYRVHRHFFIRESVVFRHRLPPPAPADADVEGESDDGPIVLEGVNNDDFKLLLWV